MEYVDLNHVIKLEFPLLSHEEKLCFIFFGGLVLDNLSIPCCLRRLHIFLLYRNFMTLTLLLIAILIMFNKTEYTINYNDIFSFVHFLI